MPVPERKDPDKWGYTRYAAVLFMPEDDRRKVDALRAQLPKVTAMIQAHVTVKGSFDSPDDLDQVRHRIRAIAATTAPFDVELADLQVRGPGAGYDVVISPAIRALHDALYEAIDPITRNVYGGSEAVADFRPHMTVCQEMPLDAVTKAEDLARDMDIGTRFPVNSLHLMGLVGPRHGGHWEVVGEFPFTGLKPDFRPIGVVRTSVTEAVDQGWGAVVSEVHLESVYAPGLQGLERFSHAVIVTWLHLAAFDPKEHLLRRPQGRADMPEVGIFAQRARHRPNPIGITAVEVLGIDGNVLRVRGLDAIDGTPVLDVRPYFPAYDRVARPEVPDWVGRLMEGYF